MSYTRKRRGGTIALAIALAAAPAVAQNVIQTPTTPMELPIEVEIELSPAGSLKQAPLWKELYQMLQNPYAPVERRPGFGAVMPPLNVYPLGYNFLTAQPLRLRTSDGEVSWDQPGPMFDTEEVVPLDAYNTPTALRSVVGHLVACPDDPSYQAVAVPASVCEGKPEGSLVVYNSTGSEAIPPDGTVVAVAAFFDGMLHEYDPETGELEEVTELEAPVNEEDFFRSTTDTTGIPAQLVPYIGRAGAEILGKALFWDMQVGSDGVQSCGTCHFHAGVDSRTRGQLNPNTLGGNVTSASLEVKPPNTDVEPADFPFRKLQDPSLPSEGDPAQVVLRDADDVMSSMGVSRFKRFVDVPPIGAGSFGAPSAVGGVRPLVPDVGVDEPDPVAVMDGLRRVEPRNTPTFHGAAFNLDNFWDGRARFNFNGGSVFGPSDPTPHIYVNPGLATGGAGAFTGATMGHLRPELNDPDEEEYDPVLAAQPVRIKFSSLGSQAVGPPLSDFEMSFAGRNWPKIGKKLLQGEPNAAAFGNGAPQQPGTNRASAVVPLANQLVAVDDSRLGPFSNQGGSACAALARPTAAGKPGLCIAYGDLIRLSFARQYWNRINRHLVGAPDAADPFDGYALTVAVGAGDVLDTNHFRQMEANFSAFFGLAVQAYEALVIPDDTPADRFFDANPNAGHGVGEPGDQAVLFPTLVPDLIDDGLLNGSAVLPTPGLLNLVPDDPATPEYDGFGPDEVFGFDIFAGANLTAALPAGSPRNPIHTITRPDGTPFQIAVGSNPFTRSAKCMLCHLGPEQTDHSINISHGLLKNDAEFEYPTPPFVADPDNLLGDGTLPAPEPSGSSMAVGGLILAEEVGEGPPQDAVEVEPRNFASLDDPATPWDDRVVAQPGNFAFGDQGVYNIGVRPNVDDPGRGGDDPFGWPLSLSALTLKNIGGADFEPCDGPGDSCVMGNFDPTNIEGDEAAGLQGFEETGDGAFFPGTTHTLQSINPGFERDPILPQMPDYFHPWINHLPAGELHPQIDEQAGMLPNVVTPPNGGPAIEFPEVMFGADLHCASYDPALFGLGPPNWGWGSPLQTEGPSLCPQHQSGVAGNFAFPVHGTWPVPNRVLRDGAFKAPPLRNVELTGPYFHTGSYLTLRQVVDFYVRGGDFPVSNADSRDPHVTDLARQTFAFGRTTGADLSTPISSGILEGTFADGLPDPVFQYDEMPDADHPVTPETATPEDAKAALVKFLISLTDPRVRYERAPFDRPEIFVPIDAAAPENPGDRAQLIAQSGVACPPTAANPAPTGTCFRRLHAVGAGGNTAGPDGIPGTADDAPTAVPTFLGVASVPTPDVVPGVANDHFDR
jgi:cytochrome c peroxidase